MTSIQFGFESQPGSVLSMAEDLELWGMEEMMMQPSMDKANQKQANVSYDPVNDPATILQELS